MAGANAVIDLSDRAKLRVSGADRVRYLNGQISNDLRKANESQTVHACLLSAKGKINADVFIVADGDSFLVDTESEMREQLAARLERYVIADDVQIEDVTETFALLHVIGPDVPEPGSAQKHARADRFGSPGTDIWMETSKREEALQELATTFSILDEASCEVLRIERGIPRWGFELTDEIIPTEANLEASAIDFAKGCYIGQEVISRIKMSGQTNKRLCGVVSVGEGTLGRGMRLSSDGKDVGWLTSAAWSERLGKQVTLGFVKRGFWAAGQRLEAVGEREKASSVIAEIVELPFSF